MARIHPHGLSRVTAHFHWHPSLYFRLTGLTALLKRSFTTLCFRKTEVIDAAANCTAMVHLPGKRALFCIVKNAAAMRCERSAPLRADSVSRRLCVDARATRRREGAARRRARHRSTKFYARIWCATRGAREISARRRRESRGGHASPRAMIRSLRLRELLRPVAARGAQRVFVCDLALSR